MKRGADKPRVYKQGATWRVDAGVGKTIGWNCPTWGKAVTSALKIWAEPGSAEAKIPWEELECSQ
jgi:hypothetical protein